MPFSRETKASVLIRSARICCLCYKVCGTKIEVAHIVAEASGGSGDEGNAIPLCFDCHQETGAYNSKHPKGNKFGVEELQSRRDQLYRLVESGALAARVVAYQTRGIRKNKKGMRAPPPVSSSAAAPSAEARGLIAQGLSGENLDALGLKVSLLGDRDRAAVLDTLIDQSAANAEAVEAMGAILSADILAKEEQLLIVERIVRRITLLGTTKTKAGLLERVPVEILKTADEGLRLAFFKDVIGIVKLDQFKDVNEIVRPLTEAQGAIPKDLCSEYVKALVEQADSRSWQGAPAARRALERLPPDLAKALFKFTDAHYLTWHAREKTVRDLLTTYQSAAPPSKRKLVADFLRMSPSAFIGKYDPD